MLTSDLGADLLKLRERAASLADGVLTSNAEAVDREAIWPEEGMSARAQAGLMGLHVPRRLGGHDQGLLALSVITEELGRAFSENSKIARLHRDARAANIMSPTTHLLQTWLGRSLLDLLFL